VQDWKTWAHWLTSDPAAWQVATTRIGKRTVATVFVGIDYRRDGHAPQLFETMIFDRAAATPCARDGTWDAAKKGHAEVVASLKRRAR